MEPDEIYETGWAMRQHGGSFVKALGVALGLADPDNAERIKKTFSEYWANYLKIGKQTHAILKSHEGEFRCIDCLLFFRVADPPCNCPNCGSSMIELQDGSLPE